MASDFEDLPEAGPLEACRVALEHGEEAQLRQALQSLAPETVRQAAECLREQGSKAFATKEYEEALRCYSHALVGLPSDPKLLSNLSATHLALRQIPQAVEAARRCVRADSTWAKGFYRLGAALQLAGNLHDAFAAFRQALTLEPANAHLRERVSSLQASLQERAGATRLAKQLSALSTGLGSEGVNRSAEADGANSARGPFAGNPGASANRAENNTIISNETLSLAGENHVGSASEPTPLESSTAAELASNRGTPPSQANTASPAAAAGAPEVQGTLLKQAQREDAALAVDSGLFRPAFSTARVGATSERFFRPHTTQPASPGPDPAASGLVKLCNMLTVAHSARRELSFFSALLASGANAAVLARALEALATRLQQTPRIAQQTEASLSGDVDDRMSHAKEASRPTPPHVLLAGHDLGVSAVTLARALGPDAKVVVCEPRPVQYHALAQVLADHGVAERTVLVPQALEQLAAAVPHTGKAAGVVDSVAQPPPRCDPAAPAAEPTSRERRAGGVQAGARALVLSAIDSGLLGLRLLPAVRTAMREGLLCPDAIVFPALVRVHAALAECRTGTLGGTNCTQTDRYRWAPSSLSVCTASERDCRLVSQSVCVFEARLDRSLQLTGRVNEQRAMTPTVCLCVECTCVCVCVCCCLCVSVRVC
jgi:tetratricopeptide (TPR) repeat protein